MIERGSPWLYRISAGLVGGRWALKRDGSLTVRHPKTHSFAYYAPQRKPVVFHADPAADCWLYKHNRDRPELIIRSDIWESVATKAPIVKGLFDSVSFKAIVAAYGEDAAASLQGDEPGAVSLTVLEPIRSMAAMFSQDARTGHATILREVLGDPESITLAHAGLRIGHYLWASEGSSLYHALAEPRGMKLLPFVGFLLPDQLLQMNSTPDNDASHTVLTDLYD